MKRRILSLLVSLALCLALFPSWGVTAEEIQETEGLLQAPSICGRLAVRGTQLVDQQGEAVQLSKLGHVSTRLRTAALGRGSRDT